MAMEEILLRIKSEKSVDEIRSIMEELGIEIKMIMANSNKPWMAGEPFTEQEIEDDLDLAKKQIAAGNYYTLDDVKKSVNHKIQIANNK